jgi:hypothetical protein
MPITFTPDEQSRIQKIEAFLRLVRPTGLIEVRTFGHPQYGAIRHLSADHRRLAQTAIMIEQVGRPDYFVTNPINAGTAYGMLYTTKGPVRRAGVTAGDRHILCRSLYLVDIDTIREGDVSASAEEKADALRIAKKVGRYLIQHSFPEPVVVDSGNGYQLLYRGDACAPDSDLWAFILRHLNEQFGTATVKVDPVVHNPARLARIPYTWNRKGPDTPERPHRLSEVIHTPDKFEVVPYSAVHTLATEAGYEEAPIRTYSRAGGGDMPELVDDPEEAILAFVDEYSDHISITAMYNEGSERYFALDSCPFAGRRHRKWFAGKTSIVLTDKAVGFNCFSDDCAYYHMSDLRNLMERETGRKSQVRFYKSQPVDVDQYADRWGGVDDLSPTEPPTPPPTATPARVPLSIEAFRAALERA